MPALADAMLACGVHYRDAAGYQQLLGPLHRHHEQEGDLIADPLLPETMIDKIDRYLGASAVDFFYLTLRK